MFLDSLQSTLVKLFSKPEYKEQTRPLQVVSNSIATITEGFMSAINTESLNDKDNFKLYNEMDENSPEACLALDFLSNLICQGDDLLQRGHRVDVAVKGQTNKKTVKDDLHYTAYFDAKTAPDKYKNILANANDIIKRFEVRTKIKSTLKPKIRKALKYGDSFSQILWGTVKENGQKRIVGFYDYDSSQVELNIDKYGQLDEAHPYYITSVDQIDKKFFEPYQIMRFSFNGEASHKKGVSLLKSVRKTYKRLDAMESGSVIGRLVRAHIRYLFKVDTSNIAHDKKLQYIDQVKEAYTKKQMINADGTISLVNHTMEADQDIFFGVSKDGKDDVTVLQGDQYVSNIEDILHQYNRYVLGLRLPKAAMDVSGSRNAVAEQETYPIRFARDVQTSTLRPELERIYKLELAAHGISEDMLEYLEIEMPEIDSVSTVRKFNVERTRAEIVKIYKDAGVVPDRYILENILYLSDNDIDELTVWMTKQKEAELSDTEKMMKLTEKFGQKDKTNEQYNSPVRTNTKYNNKKLGKASNAYTTSQQTE